MVGCQLVTLMEGVQFSYAPPTLVREKEKRKPPLFVRIGKSGQIPCSRIGHCVIPRCQLGCVPWQASIFLCLLSSDGRAIHS